MSDDLPAWTPKGVQPKVNVTAAEQQAPKRGVFGRLFEVFLVLVVVACLLGGGYALYRQWNYEPSAGADDEVATAAAGDQGGATSSGGQTTGTVASATTEQLGSEPAPNGDCEVRCARIKAGVIYLEGRMPTQEAYDSQYENAVETMGGDEARVVNNLEITPDAPASVDTYRVYIDDVIFFDTGSAVLDTEQAQVLILGVAFLAINPDSTIIVVGHTDASGDIAANYELSLERARAVKEFFVSAGAPGERIHVVPRGELDATGEDDTAEDRRVEFQLGNVEDPPPDGAVDIDS